MAARMKVEDRCCKKKQRQRWAMIYLDPKGLRLPSFPLLFLPGEARDKREGFFLGGGGKGGRCSQNGKEGGM